jgi:hypothetical protein
MPEGVRYASAMAQSMVRESASTGSDAVANAVRPEAADGAAGASQAIH